MNKFFKSILTILGVIAGLLIIIFTISFTNHKYQLSKEDTLFKANGKMVMVNGHNMHVYSEGEGDNTLVFLSGGGTSSPVLDFKSLYSLMSDKYKIVVVEKAGYGFSEKANIDRDIDSILEETREALIKADLEAPYILIPHSMSGIEGLYWVQKYPDEIEGIIGLDMAVPEAYDNYQINKTLLNISAFGSKIGITRFFPSVVNDSAPIKYGTLSDKEKETYRAVFYRRTATNSMLKEVDMIKRNAEKVKKEEKPDIPILLFVSNGEGTGWGKEEWMRIQDRYLEALENSKSIKYDVAHYIHDIEYENIAENSIVFIEKVINKN